MADFELAISKTLDNEGGDKYTETLGDRGGATKYGISLKFMTECIYDLPDELKKVKGTVIERLFIRRPTKDTIRYLTECEAKFIYKMYFWDRNRYGEIEDQDVADKVFDMAVLMGAPRANIIAQSVFHVGNLSRDGIMGPKTISYINTCEDYLDCLIRDFIKHFISICNKDRSQDRFLLGWLNRVMS